MFCRKCGKELKEGAKFCTGCGNPIEINPTQPAPGPAPEPVVKPEPAPVPSRIPDTDRQPAPAKRQVKPEPEPKKKGKGGAVFAIIILVLLLICAAAAAVFFLVVKPKMDDKDSGKSVKTESVSSESETEEAVSNEEYEELFMDKLSDLTKQYGDYTDGKEYEFDNKIYGYVNDSKGVFGYIIQEISGDDIPEMIVVYSDSDDSIAMYADIFTIEDDEVVAEKEHLSLTTSETLEDSEALVYLVKYEDEFYLCGETAASGYRLGDGSLYEFAAYKCTDNRFKQVNELYFYGSDFADEYAIDELEKAAENVGFNSSNIDGRSFGQILAMDNSGVIGIVGVANRFDNGIDVYEFFNVRNYDQLPIGKVKVQSLAKDGVGSEKATSDFLSKYSYREEYDFARFGSSTTAGMNEDFIFPFSSDRLITDADIAPFANDKLMLSIARNEIYAKHGYQFSTNQDMINYFSAKDWYYPTTTDQSAVYNSLSQIEKDNIAFIKAYEDRL